MVMKTEKKEYLKPSVIVEDLHRKLSVRESAPNYNPNFVFSGGNRMTITWGYLEDSNSHRTINFRIKTIQTNFSESQGVKTSIIGFDGTDDANSFLQSQQEARVIWQKLKEENINKNEKFASRFVAHYIQRLTDNPVSFKTKGDPLNKWNAYKDHVVPLTKGQKVDRDTESVTNAIGAYVNSYMQIKSQEFKDLFNYDPSSISTIPTPDRGNNG